MWRFQELSQQNKKSKRKRDREDMTLEEREAALAIGAYDKRSHYQLRDDPVSLLREQLLRDRPVYTAQSLARYEEANHAKRMQAIQQYVQPQPR